MVEQIQAQIAADRDEGEGRDPACQAPQQIVAGDQDQQDRDGAPQPRIADARIAQRIDQILYAILRADGAADGGEHGNQHGQMAAEPAPDIVQQEPGGPSRGITR